MFRFCKNVLTTTKIFPNLSSFVKSNVWQTDFILIFYTVNLHNHLSPPCFSNTDPYGIPKNSSCRFYSVNKLIPELFMMNNPARTSTVILENYYVQVANYYKNTTYKLVKNFSKSETGLWACKISVQWPMNNEFYAEQSKKSEAARVASCLAIDWLKSQNKIDSDGRPLLVREQNPSISLDLDKSTIDSIRSLINKFDQQIQPVYEETARLYDGQRTFYEDCQIPSYRNLDADEILKRNRDLQKALQEMNAKTILPIDALGDDIVRTIERNRVVVIKGHTGSGKTTRVPQMIFDSYIRQNRGTECNIVVTQPRRISATSLASRIAFERDENVGLTVGFHVRLNLIYPTCPGTIMFVSTGILLQRMISDPDLNSISHIIIDEAHERDVNIDLLLLLTKDLLEKNENIRVVIMSATINPELFQQYFNNCPLIAVPGVTFNVNVYYIEDIMKHKNFQNDNYEWDAVDIDDNLILDVVNWIHINKEPGAILVFLPGWTDISKMQNILQQNQDLVVVVAHSKLKIEQQQLIFMAPPIEKRKVILATNIAESSITIPDVVYVIDSGIVRETGNYNGISGLTNTWISKAVADQRKGRAGRLKDGECYRLYSKKKYNSFVQYPVPEIMRTPLEKLIMNLKMYKNEKLWDALSKFPEPPPQNAVVDAVAYLQGINIIDTEEDLTPLGRRIAPIALHPTLSVALAYSLFFDCFDPALIVTSFLNGDLPVFGIDVRSSKRRAVLTDYHSTNDSVAIFNLYREWKIKSNPTSSVPQIDPNINHKSLQNADQILKLNANYLQKAHLMSTEEMYLKEDICNKEYHDELNFIAPIFLAATGKLAVNARPYFANGKVNHYLTTLDGFKVQISNDSVNFKNNRLTSPFLTFYNMSTTEGFLRIYDTAPVSPAAVLLFCPVLPQIFNAEAPNMVEVVYPNVGLHMAARSESVNALLYLRDMLWRSIDHYIRFYDAYIPESEPVRQFKTELRAVLTKIV